MSVGTMECPLAYNYSTYECNVPVGAHLLGKLSRLVSISDTALWLHGPIPERRSRGGMQCTPFAIVYNCYGKLCIVTII